MTPIETALLLLRAITPADRDELFELHTDPEVQKYTGESVVDSKEKIDKAIEKRQRDYAKHGFGRMATIIKETGEFVGWAGLTYLPEFAAVDLGYRFKTKYWGRGYATEASQAILKQGFEMHKLDEIVAIALPENKASIRVMQKVGMNFDKLAPYDDEIEETVWYKMTKEEYKDRLK
jgi:RimJ/RimL family protein N-acetyltransferase